MYIGDEFPALRLRMPLVVSLPVQARRCSRLGIALCALKHNDMQF